MEDDCASSETSIRPRTLPYGTPEDVAAEVRDAIDAAAPGGGYILASDHSLS